MRISDWSSDVCSSDLAMTKANMGKADVARIAVSSSTRRNMTPDAAAIPAFSTAASSYGLRSRRDSSDMTAVEDTVAAIDAAASVPSAAPSRLPAHYPAKERPVTRTTHNQNKAGRRRGREKREKEVK